ncbi:MAG: RDD family protein [Candidatus Melainabacteria bacterium]|nr:RDD family protein [Candidatus Melainabacteria bacterium]
MLKSKTLSRDTVGVHLRVPEELKPEVLPPLAADTAVVPEPQSRDNDKGALPEPLPKCDGKAIHIAMPLWRYYWLRSFDFSLGLLTQYVAGAAFVFVQFLVLGLICLIVPGLSAGLQAKYGFPQMLLTACQAGVLWSACSIGIVIFCTQYLCARKGETLITALRIVDKSGKPLGRWRAALRAALYLGSVFCFPLCLITVAAGSRRFFHDFCSGSYVLTEGEDPARTFYPPRPAWLLPLFAWLVIVLLCNSGRFSTVRETVENIAAGTMLGVQSRNYMDYLAHRFVYDLNAPMTQEQAKVRVTQAEALLSLQVRYLGLRDYETARTMLNTAVLASRAGDVQKTQEYVNAWLKLPVQRAERMLRKDEFLSVAQGKAAQLVAARLLVQAGSIDDGISQAQACKDSAAQKDDYKRYADSCEFLANEYEAKGDLASMLAQKRDLFRCMEVERKIYADDKGERAASSMFDADLRQLTMEIYDLAAKVVTERQAQQQRETAGR